MSKITMLFLGIRSSKIIFYYRKHKHCFLLKRKYFIISTKMCNMYFILFCHGWRCIRTLTHSGMFWNVLEIFDIYNTEWFNVKNLLKTFFLYRGHPCLIDVNQEHWNSVHCIELDLIYKRQQMLNISKVLGLGGYRSWSKSLISRHLW